MIKHIQVPNNFVYPDVKTSDFRFGTLELMGVVLKPDGDWRNYVPDGELQDKNGIVSSACYVEAQQHTIATIQEEQFDIPNKNYSARFNALLSNGTPSGGSPIDGANSIRKDGLVDDGVMTYTPDIQTWADYHSFKGVNEQEIRGQGQLWLKDWEPKYDIVIERYYDINTKYAKLKEALTYSPVPISVAAWWEKDGVYIKPSGERDNHLVECVYVDADNHPYVWDTYEPYLKKLEKNFDFEFAMRWSISRLEKKPVDVPVDQVKKNGLIELIRNLWNLIFQIEQQKANLPTPSPTVPQVEPKPVPKDLLNKFCLAIQTFEGWHEGSMSFKRNNPGNIRGGDGNFLTFTSYAQGFAYLKEYVKRACMGKHSAYKPTFTFYQFFNVYAPSFDNNSPKKYAEFVCQKTGVKPTDKISILI